MSSIQIEIKDGLSSSVAVKGPCRVATTANITLSGEQTIDGVAVVTDDRVLVKNQTSASENGIYVVDTGVWRRSKDFNKTRDVRKGTMVIVAGGTVGSGLWQVTTADPIDVGTSNIAFQLAVPDTSGFITLTGTQTLTNKTLTSPTVNGGTVDSATITSPTITGATMAINDNAFTIRDNGDTTKVLAFQLSGFTTATTRTITWPDTDGTVWTTGQDATVAHYRANTADKILTTDIVWSSAAEVTLTDAATIAVDMSTFINAVVTLGGNRTLGNPTNEKASQSGCIRIVQDGTGSRTLAYGTDWEFASATPPVLTTTAGATDLLFYHVIAADRIFGNLVKAVG
ncbi:MAG: hypothetical protein EOR57_31600 [Mesorhizobium sp.]|uniref:hypothetical protein n=1 Tax=Mesorhizobium sp. TaxID=1871066 RepID=UPI000FE9D2D3|nr:hypothetical protein [Mesorhizobium sp.]RWL14893.1 MAG: hypothetical protein EOR57_31600 [Mesorhizobium sp.]